jgi:hypothetical protein
LHSSFRPLNAGEDSAARRPYHFRCAVNFCFWIESSAAFTVQPSLRDLITGRSLSRR